MTSVTLLHQNPHDEASHFYTVVNQQLESSTLTRVRVTMAYVSWGGLSLVADALERFLCRKGRFSSIFGVGNGVTTSDALCYAHYLQTKFKGQAESFGFAWNYYNSTFHSKMFEFFHNDHATVIIGSANLTNGGLAANHELALSVTADTSDALVNGTDSVWREYLKLSHKVNPTYIQGLEQQKELGREGRARGRAGESLELALKRAKKPLFAHILQGNNTPKLKRDTFSGTSTLSEKPTRLYLEILRETGGGHQVQLPVATLATFFGIGKGEARDVSFHFKNGDEVNVQLTHFGNNTHRVRLRPIQGVPRPSILVFERSDEDDDYNVSVVAQRSFRKVIRERCTEQTRDGSRRWGFE